jgi:hypothetical protein
MYAHAYSRIILFIWKGRRGCTFIHTYIHTYILNSGINNTHLWEHSCWIGRAVHTYMHTYIHTYIHTEFRHKRHSFLYGRISAALEGLLCDALEGLLCDVPANNTDNAYIQIGTRMYDVPAECTMCQQTIHTYAYAYIQICNAHLWYIRRSGRFAVRRPNKENRERSRHLYDDIQLRGSWISHIGKRGYGVCWCVYELYVCMYVRMYVRTYVYITYAYFGKLHMCAYAKEAPCV